MIDHSNIINDFDEGLALNLKQEIKTFPTEDLYALLGLDNTATQGEITRAYRKLAMKCHPDLNHANAKKTEIFKLSTRAYMILSDHKKRQEYDRLVDPIWKRLIVKCFNPKFSLSEQSAAA